MTTQISDDSTRYSRTTDLLTYLHTMVELVLSRVFQWVLLTLKFKNDSLGKESFYLFDFVCFPFVGSSFHMSFNHPIDLVLGFGTLRSAYGNSDQSGLSDVEPQDG